MRKLRHLGMLVALLVCTALAWSQGGVTGTILGTVTDTTGAVIAGAPVDITNIDTGVTTHVATTSTGDYTAPNLIPDNYKVSVVMQGFSKAVVNNITLVVAQQARINVQLKPGATSETIEVAASAVQLDTDTASVSQVVSERQMSELPINGRNFVDLLFVGAGAVQTRGEQGQMRQNEGNAISLNGARPESNNYTLDGTTNTDTALGTPAVILSQDAIQEFKVQDATYSAQYGFSANQVNIVSKSGGNKFHASIFEFDRNDAFDAIAHTTPSNTSTTKTELRQNQFGYVLSGPVTVPHFYSGADRTFFMANYEGQRKIRGGHMSGVAPTTAVIGGNFQTYSTLPIYDGTTSGACYSTYLVASQNCRPIDPETGQPFANDEIPTARWSRLAKVAVNYVPTATTALDSNGYNFYATANTKTNTDQQTYRLDESLGKYGQVFFRYTKADYANNAMSTASLKNAVGADVFTENSTAWTAAYTVPLAKGFVNDFRIGNLSAKSIEGATGASTSDITALGLTGTFANLMSLPSYAAGYPNISFGVTNGVSGGSPGNNPTTSDIPNWMLTDSVVKQVGGHSFAFGFEYRQWIQKRDLSTNFLGSYSYAPNQVALNGTGSQTTSGHTKSCSSAYYCGTGNSFADFLLGYYSSASTFQPGPFSSKTGAPGNLNQYHFKYFAPYFEDDWKVNSKLTINLGLRYDFRTIPVEENDKMFWIDTHNTDGGLCYAKKALLTDGIAPEGNGFYRYCGRRNPVNPSYAPWAPRVGFAYRPLEKYVVRGGYGIFFDSSETREIDDSGDIYPFVTRASVSPASTPSQYALKSTNDLFVPVSSLAAVGDAQKAAFYAVIISEQPKNPYVQQYTLSVERELAKNTTLELNYVGNRGSHLLRRNNMNQAGAVPSWELAHCQANPTDVSGSYTCPASSRRPYTNFTSSTGFLDSQWDMNSNYNSANVKLERRASEGAILFIYTFAKSLDMKSAAAGIGSTNAYAGVMDEKNPHRDYGRSDFDVSHRFVASYAYMLPVGKGKKLLANANTAVNAVVGGWEVTGIGTFQQGFPFSALGNDVNGLLNTYTQRAIQTGNPNSGFTKSSKKWFNTSAFSENVAGVFGTAGRNNVREPGISNWDMGLVKYTDLGKGVKFQFRVETFNTFNHPQWGLDPSGQGGGSSSVGTSVYSPATFGVLQTMRSPREVQLGGKITF